jgi:transcriptional regulator with XRE-family HTH domain
MLSDNSNLIELGQRLRARRLERNETQARFAARLGISIPTLRRMEKGDAACPIGNWAQALEILGAADGLNQLLRAPESLFDQAKLAQTTGQTTRKRARP